MDETSYDKLSQELDTLRTKSLVPSHFLSDHLTWPRNHAPQMVETQRDCFHFATGQALEDTEQDEREPYLIPLFTTEQHRQRPRKILFLGRKGSNNRNLHTTKDRKACQSLYAYKYSHKSFSHINQDFRGGKKSDLYHVLDRIPQREREWVQRHDC